MVVLSDSVIVIIIIETERNIWLTAGKSSHGFLETEALVGDEAALGAVLDAVGELPCQQALTVQCGS